MTCPRFDFHLHTPHMKCANNSMDIEAVVRKAEQLGMSAIGFTDHLNRMEQADTHLAIRSEIENLDAGIEVYFGAELNFTGPDEGFAYSEDIRDRIGFQFAIGGIHSTYIAVFKNRNQTRVKA